MFRKFLTLGLVLAIAVTTSAFFGGNKADNLYKVGRAKISKSDVESRISRYPAKDQQAIKSNPENQQKLIDQLIDEEVLFQLAKKEGMHRNKEFKKQVKQAKRQLLINTLIKERVDDRITVTEAEKRNYYNANQQEFKKLETRDISHILVKSRKTANRIRKRLLKKESFAKLAKRYSIDPTKDNGGNLGWVRRDALVKEFADAAFTLRRKGRFSKVIKTQFGYHIIKYNDRQIRPAVPFNKASDQIKSFLTSQKQQKLFRALIKEGKDEIKVKSLSKK